jgi:hypothetical protein
VCNTNDIVAVVGQKRCGGFFSLFTYSASVPKYMATTLINLSTISLLFRDELGSLSTVTSVTFTVQ